MRHLFKLGMALVFSVIAALIVLLVGLFGDARISTVFLRSLIAFITAGLLTFLVTYVLEAKGWAAFDKNAEERMADLQKILYDTENVDFDEVDAKDTGTPAQFAARDSFQPLAEETLVHMTIPPEEHAVPTGEGTPAPA